MCSTTAYRENVIAKGRKPQPSVIRHAQEEPLVAASDWLMLLDADEFLCINHAGTLDGMLEDAVARDANGIVVTWRIFGSGGRMVWSRAEVTEDHKRATTRDWNKGWGQDAVLLRSRALEARHPPPRDPEQAARHRVPRQRALAERVGTAGRVILPVWRLAFDLPH